MDIRIKLIIYFILILFLKSCSSAVPAAQTDGFRQLSSNHSETIALTVDDRRQIAAEYVTLAAVYKQQGKYAESIIEFQEALRWDTTASIYFAMAQSYANFEKIQNAIESCYKSIELDSTYLPSYELLYGLYYNSRMFKEAYIVSDQLERLEPSRENKIRIAVLKSLDSPTESLKLLESLLVDSTDIEVLLLLSAAYEQTEQYDKMALILEKVISNHPENFDVIETLIDYYVTNKKYDHAFRLLEKSDKQFDSQQISRLYYLFGHRLSISDDSERLKIIPKFISKIDERFYFDWIIQSIAGKLSSITYDTLQMQKFYERAFGLADTSSFLYIDAAISYSNLQLINKSIEFLEAGKSKFSDDLRFDFYICNAYLMNDNFEKALEFSSILVDSDSNNVLYLTTHGSVLQELMRYDDSDYFYEKALTLDPKDALSSNNYAYSLSIRSKDLRKALKLSSFSLEVEPDNVAYLDTYGWIQYQLGNYEVALEYILKAVEKDGVSSEVFEHLGDIYKELNKIDSAIESYNKSLEIDSKSDRVLNKIKLLKQK